MEGKIKDEVGDRSPSEVRTVAEILHRADACLLAGY